MSYAFGPPSADEYVPYYADYVRRAQEKDFLDVLWSNIWRACKLNIWESSLETTKPGQLCQLIPNIPIGILSSRRWRRRFSQK
jgi:hypothetical protein